MDTPIADDVRAEARKYADEGNYDEAKRLLAFARDFLDEESSNPGIE